MVAPIRSYGSLGRSAQAKRSAGPGFALPDAEASQEAQAASSIPQGLGLIGLQQSWTPAERDASAARRGSALLHELARLQLSMLSGEVDMGTMSRLANLPKGKWALILPCATSLREFRYVHASNWPAGAYRQGDSRMKS